jgi:uncharacterized protein involved in exopolysaccharide biosynthesis/Mrp family chromosome partitioning ATPase
MNQRYHPAPDPLPEPMTPLRPGVVTLRDAAHIIFRHQWKIAAFAATVTVIAGFGVLTTPPLYLSEAQLLVKRGRESMTLDPTATTGEVMPIYQDWENQLNSELAILSSRELAERTAEEIGVETLLGRSTDTASWLDRVRLRVRKGYIRVGRVVWPFRDWAALEETELQRATTQLRRDLAMELLPKSNIISLSYRGGDPKLAQRILTTLINAYFDKHLAVYRTPGSHNFFVQQRDQLGQHLRAIEEELTQLKTGLGMPSVEAQRTLLLARLNETQEGIDKAEAFIAAATAKVAAMSRLQPLLGESLAPTGDGRLPIGRQDYNELKLTLLTEEAALAARRAELETLKLQLQKTRDELTALNDPDLLAQEQRIQHLEREKSIVDVKYRKYSEDLEHARIGQALETEKISNIAIVQAATLPEQAINSATGIKLILIVLFGLLGGGGLAFVWEFLDRTIRKPEDVEDKLQLPTLVSIPVLTGAQLSLLGRPAAGADAAAAEDEGLWAVSNQTVELFETLRDRLLLSTPAPAGPPTLIGFTSCYPGEGVSTVALNTAYTLSRHAERPVLLVDAHLRHPALHDLLGARRLAGVAEILVEGQGKIVAVEPRLHFLGAGELHRNLPSSMVPQKIELLLQVVNAPDFSYVIFDMPPLSEGAFVVRLARHLHSVALVMESERVRWEPALRARRLLEEGGKHLRGVVLNKRRYYVPEWFYRRM